MLFVVPLILSLIRIIIHAAFHLSQLSWNIIYSDHYFNIIWPNVRRRQWQPTLVLLPGKPHGWRNLVGCSPWGWEESDTTEWLHFHFSLWCIGEGNGNPLQCSCLENPRDDGAWWAAVYGVAQSWTQLKWLSSSSSSKGVGLAAWDFSPTHVAPAVRM